MQYIYIGMPGETIYPGDCERTAIPVGSTLGHNAADIRQARQVAGMSFGFRARKNRFNNTGEARVTHYSDRTPCRDLHDGQGRMQ